MATRKAIEKVPTSEASASQRRQAASKPSAKVLAMTSRKNGAARQAPKDALQFAPNFSAYLLPNTVCFYSEDRKFFLHGELFCALVAEIAKGGKNVRQLIDTVGRSFPPDKVADALNRLVERR
jgi:oxazoline/thiazoline synthase